VKIENQEKALQIVEEIVKAVKIPVSVKTRLGWSDSDLLLDFAKSLESAGCKCLMIHGRTTQQQYTGKADYEPIYKVKDLLNIPVLGNGDINSAQDAKDKLGNLDGLLVGRGTWGNPWMMKDVQNYFDTGKVTQTELTMAKKIPAIKKHCKLMVETKGEKRGVMEMRKFLLMYAKGFPGAKEMRKDLVMVETMKDVERVLKIMSTKK
jgi:nifR3 family TIM-barrel protein